MNYVYSFGWTPICLLVVVMFCLWVIITLRSYARSKSIQKRTILAIHAEEQHAQWMDGDDRGLYGRYPPANL